MSEEMIDNLYQFRLSMDNVAEEIKIEYAILDNLVREYNDTLEYKEGSRIEFITNKTKMAAYIEYKSKMLAIKKRKFLNKIKKYLISTGLYKGSEIALTTSELVNMSGAKVLVDSLIYDRSIPEESLTNLELIFGSADLTRLYDYSCLKNLKYVFYDIETNDLNTELPLIVTGGNGLFGKVKDNKMLPNYKYAYENVVFKHYDDFVSLNNIGGDIYIEDDTTINKELFSRLESFNGAVYYLSLDSMIYNGEIMESDVMDPKKYTFG